jgi:integrase
MVFLADLDVELFDERDRLKAALGSYALHRSHGPVEARFEVTTWNRHVSILSSFYRWAMAEEHATAEPFTYRQARALYTDQAGSRRVNQTRPVNQAIRRLPKPHVTVKYLEQDYLELFLRALRGLGPRGEDRRYRGRNLARNGAVGELVASTGLRRREFTFLLAVEVPPLPPRPTEVPVPFPVPAGVTKGSKFRTTWVSYAALAQVHGYLEMERSLDVGASRWRPPARWGPPLVATDADHRGGRVNGWRVSWAKLRPAERLRLVGPDGGSMLLALRSDGGPFTAWPTVFERAADRVRERFDLRFPHVHPHKLRHSMAMATLERLVSGYYLQAAQLAVLAGGPDAALALYLTKADPLMVLRDLLGHSSVLTTEKYLRRLDTARIYAAAYQRAGREHGLLGSGEWDKRDSDFEIEEEFAEELDEAGEW